MSAYEWTAEDCGALLDFCAEVGITDPAIPLQVWSHESNLDPRAHNPGGDASGIFQLMPQTAKGLGYPLDMDPHLDKFRTLTAAEQLRWARKYYGVHEGNVNSVGRFYVSTFLPVLLPHGDTPGFVLCAAQGPYCWAYLPNKGFDVDHKGWITVGDLVSAAERSYGPRAQAIAAQVTEIARQRSTQPELPDDGEDSGQV